MRIIVDRDRCCGHAMCQAEAPDLFEVQDDGSVLVLSDRPSDAQRTEVQLAIDACPTEALSVTQN